jgi:hypothetical protein
VSVSASPVGQGFFAGSCRPVFVDGAESRGLFADLGELSTGQPQPGTGPDQLVSAAEVSGDLVAPPAFKAGGRGDPTTAGSIPVHLRYGHARRTWSGAPGKGASVETVTVRVPDPGPGEALVRVHACGVCHTDLHYREGGINDDFPFLLGHEAAGVVEAVGEGVAGVAPGDDVVLPGGHPAGPAGRGCGGARGTASTRATPRSR